MNAGLKLGEVTYDDKYTPLFLAVVNKNSNLSEFLAVKEPKAI